MLGFPFDLPGFGIECDQELLAVLGALSEESAVGNSEGGVSCSERLDHPDLLGSRFGPGGKQSGFERLAVAVRAAPLIPLSRGERQQGDGKEETSCAHGTLNSWSVPMRSSFGR